MHWQEIIKKYEELHQQRAGEDHATEWKIKTQTRGGTKEAFGEFEKLIKDDLTLTIDNLKLDDDDPVWSRIIPSEKIKK